MRRLIGKAVDTGRAHEPIPITANAVEDYSRRIDSEKSFFGGDRSAYELPSIYEYWSNKYLRPILEGFGYSTPDAMYFAELARAYDGAGTPRRRFVSVGSGNCATEVAIAQQLVASGRPNFTLECVELNPELLREGCALASQRGLGNALVFVQADFNNWQPSGQYDGVIANNSLHHVVELEHLLNGIRLALRSTGTFAVSDMIGRNGHMRWPEALTIVHEHWRELPASYRYNHLLKRHEEIYANWDCSSEGFEGIRAQDILSLLIERFDFDIFVPFANVIDPFIERCFGHNFDPGRASDREFVDRVHRRDVEEIERGAIKPTHVVASMCSGRPGRNQWPPGLSPRFCVRRPDEVPVPWRERPQDLERQEASSSATDVGVTSIETSADAVRPNYSDLWWDPESPGWGIAINQHESGVLMANWLLHDSGGRPVWYSVQPCAWLDPSTYTGRVFEVTTPPSSDAVSFGPAELREVGSAKFAFDGSSAAVLSYDIEGTVGTRVIVRMEF